MIVEKFQVLVVLLPIMFMVHDFEEIVMFRPWLLKNKNELSSRFPVIITSFLTLPYCIYTFWVFNYAFELAYIQILFLTVIGIGLTILNFPFAFYCSFKFENWKNRHYLD